MSRLLCLLLVLAGAVVQGYPPELEKLCTDEQAELEYERIKFYELTQCLAQEVNASAFRQEILEAGDTYRVDAIVGKLCMHLPAIMECTGRYVSSIGPCMDAHERREKELWRSLRMMNMEFACGQGRRDLVRFIDDGGIACVAARRSDIGACVDRRFPALLRQQSDTQLVKVLSAITREEDRCSNLNEVEECIGEELLHCMQPESLNIIRQYFSSLDMLFECANGTKPMKPTNPPVNELMPSEYGPPTISNIARMHEDSIGVLSRMKHLAEDRTQREEMQAAADADMERHLVAHIRQQTRLVERMAEALAGASPPRPYPLKIRFKKEPRLRKPQQL